MKNKFYFNLEFFFVNLKLLRNKILDQEFTLQKNQ